jgi:hypothetical protein
VYSIVAGCVVSAISLLLVPIYLVLHKQPGINAVRKFIMSHLLGILFLPSTQVLSIAEAYKHDRTSRTVAIFIVAIVLLTLSLLILFPPTGIIAAAFATTNLYLNMIVVGMLLTAVATINWLVISNFAVQNKPDKSPRECSVSYPERSYGTSVFENPTDSKEATLAAREESTLASSFALL